MILKYLQYIGVAASFYFLNEDDSDGSSQPDDDGSDEGETDDHSHEEFQVIPEDQLERRNVVTTGAQRNNLAPLSMQWAIRNRDSNRSSVRLPGGSSLVFIDPSAIRRTTTANAAVAATQESQTLSTTASSLARAFGIVLRQVCQLFNTLTDLYNNGTLQNMNLTYQDANQLHMALETRLKPTWDWMLTVMDATEAQLRFGASLTHSTDSSHPLHPLHTNNPAPQATTAPLNTINVLGGIVNIFVGFFFKPFLINVYYIQNLGNSQTRNRPLGAGPGDNAQNTNTTSPRIVGFSTAADNQRNFDRDGM